ncbi:hypothetical protein MNEG_12646 [Monoraphidium neglectum]|uniref:Uncharacterized protein n=1 Tax=Monoraphidium neglectum TaxID=145388 RepID=A0A0D2MK59_9CHLO|nr:hypothetical protein MNEG_12646 [Monoraphidium neglectum]KIY95315.1 hypothetical protein MNEG_12646 [Monoraphidium neglectum]|eukprot:XP_013894335.1 hypothetical protein MNEG_12646 [Monoraphidium neglectum]
MDVGLDSYCCLGLAHCFRKKEDGKLEDVFVIEPLSATSLECMATGARTSFKVAVGVKVADALSRNKGALPEAFQDGLWCEKYDARLDAAARTWQRSHAQDNLMDIVPLGKARSNFNFSLDDKRVLNMDNVVNDDDNIKQDISIDVYGRAEKQERDEKMAAAAAAAIAASAAAAAAAAEEESEEEDDLDALLAG